MRHERIIDSFRYRRRDCLITMLNDWNIVYYRLYVSVHPYFYGISHDEIYHKLGGMRVAFAGKLSLLGTPDDYWYIGNIIKVNLDSYTPLGLLVGYGRNMARRFVDTLIESGL